MGRPLGLGAAFVTADQIAGGSGASRYLDGVDVIETDATNGMNLPAEALELESPIRLRQVALRAGSGGAGEHRGGLGTVREFEVLTDGISMSYRGERHFSRPRGLFGGEDGQAARAVVIRADGVEETIPSKLVTTLNRGDRLLVETAGGAGYNPPGSRASAALANDVADGKI
ncbi:hydantoinase B/oxoprolinase family protein [Micromonospora sp. STR1s_5]|nr:hydantoinase B/oxoprolinase family protein [Micromonospora sp. STR1s_5]